VAEGGHFYPEPETKAQADSQHHFWSGKPRFYWFVVIFTGALLLVFPFQIYEILSHGEIMATPGWTAAESNGAWKITQVSRTGPAAGKLKPGDRLAAIDGDDRAARIGPHWFLNHQHPGDSYQLDIERDGARLSFPLKTAVTRVPGQRIWGSIQLIVALIFLGTGAIIGLGKASESTGRNAFLSAAFSAMFLFSIASTVMRGAGIGGWILGTTLVMDCAFGIHYLFGYWFYSRFPRPVGRTRGWAAFEYVLCGSAILLWALGVGFNIMDGLSRELSAAFASSHETITAAFLWGADTSTRKLFGVFTNLAITAVCLRNFRLIPEGDQRRRLRWAFFGAIAAVAPLFLMMAFWYVVTLMPTASDLVGLRFTLNRAVNLVVVIMPISMAYAILKHRVLGFGVAMRIGIQHLLATNVLRLLFLLPFAALVYELIAGRDRTIGNLLWQGVTKWYLLMAVCFAAGNRYRRQLTTTIDKRFFREAYNQEAVFTVLADSIKEMDSVEEIAALLSAEISKAMHPRWIAVLYRQNPQSSLSMAYASDESSRRLQAAGLSGTLEQLEHASHARDWPSIRSVCPPNERMTFDLAEANLLVPIMGTEHRLRGILVLGEKKSEEPYIAKDRALLELVCHEAGIVYENLELRGQVRKERQVQVEVLARVANHDLNLVKECGACGRCYDSPAMKCSVDESELSLTLPVERTIDNRYRLERRIGKGGMGAVYEAQDLRLNRAVAVKVMTGSLFGQTSAMRRFSREAQASARLVHPNIVRLYDYGELAAEGAFLVMEYVPGTTLRQLLAERGILPPQEAAGLLEQLLAGIEAAHASQIVHRDLKPDNIMMQEGAGGRLKILDFGLAKMRDPDASDPASKTAPGVAMGTFGYMSPEQYLGSEIDERSDIYSIGVIALEALTGKLQLNAYSFHAQIGEQVTKRFAFAGATDEHRKVAECIGRCVAIQRDDRYASAVDLRQALLPALSDCPALPEMVRAAAAQDRGKAMPEATRTLPQFSPSPE